MKQVFPSVRPRRLGTRGHSRYCYAAMRKATKLGPPTLPDISVAGPNSSANNNETPLQCFEIGTAADSRAPDSSWAVIKGWAERTLNAKFESAKDLADHIVRSNLVSSGSVTGTAVAKDSKRFKDKRKVIDDNFFPESLGSSKTKNSNSYVHI